MSRVLVTGASGFIGRHTLPLLLDHGHEVHAVARSPLTGTGDLVTRHDVDLLDIDRSASLIERVRPELLLHLAWDVAPGFWSSLSNVRWSEASLALSRTFLTAGGHRMVMAGTCAEYDWSPPLGPFRELHTPIAPATLYGVAKHATHLLAAKLAERCDAELVWGRIFYLYGPHEQAGRLVPSVANSLLQGTPTPISDGLQMRDFMHSVDVARAFVALLESDLSGPVNIASGEPVSVGEIVRRIAAETGREELLGWGQLDRPKDDPEEIVADISRLHGELGFRSQITLADGLREVVEWWRGERAGQQRGVI